MGEFLTAQALVKLLPSDLKNGKDETPDLVKCPPDELLLLWGFVCRCFLGKAWVKLGCKALDDRFAKHLCARLGTPCGLWIIFFKKKM